MPNLKDDNLKYILKIMKNNGIKVKDFIAYLETLDQERFIYVEYDCIVTFPPYPNTIDHEGNYKIIAG